MQKKKENLEFERRTREALEEIDKGNFISIDIDKLEEEMNKW